MNLLPIMRISTAVFWRDGFPSSPRNIGRTAVPISTGKPRASTHRRSNLSPMRSEDFAWLIALGLFHDGHRAIVGQPSMRWPSLSLAHGGLPYRLFWNRRDCRLGDCGHGKRLSRRRMSSKPAGIRGAQEISDDRGAGYRDVSDADKAAEVTWLRANVMEPDQSVWALRITARDRYSARCWGWGEPLAEPALQNLAGDFPQQPACIVTRSP